jgi:hypothetical protein
MFQDVIFDHSILNSETLKPCNFETLKREALWVDSTCKS